MREIKFRAWLTKEKRMVSVYRLDFTDKSGKPTLIMWYWVQQGTQAGLSRGFELMQYTGLKDKNNKEIWEGDIVRFKNDDNLYIVKWLDEFAEFMGVDTEYSDLVVEFVLPDYFEVVGNIYENPELLGKEKGCGCDE